MRTKHPSEAQVSAEVVALVRALGYACFSTEEHRALLKCPHCQQVFRSHKGSGLDPGIPDHLYFHEDWNAPVCVANEIKGQDTPASPEQVYYSQQGYYGIARGAEADRLTVEALLKAEDRCFRDTRNWERRREKLLKTLTQLADK